MGEAHYRLMVLGYGSYRTYMSCEGDASSLVDDSVCKDAERRHQHNKACLFPFSMKRPFAFQPHQIHDEVITCSTSYTLAIQRIVV